MQGGAEVGRVQEGVGLGVGQGGGEQEPRESGMTGRARGQYII